MRGVRLYAAADTELCSYDTQDSLYDVAWSEINENHLVAVSGDGSVKLFDTSVERYPVVNWHEHKREVYAASWNLISKDTIATSSWDGTVKIVSYPKPQCAPHKSFRVLI